MTLQPILIDEDKNKELYANADCQEIFKSYPSYYYEVGYNPPWIGYFVIRDSKVVGVGGFVGQPKDHKVEIAYGTFKENEGQGIASFTCKQLISVAKTTNPTIIVTAKTLPQHNASTKILVKNGFIFSGTVQDKDIGDAWEWILT
jgi:ribosomal-protein-alanine N-acetyltransferase